MLIHAVNTTVVEDWVKELLVKMLRENKIRQETIDLMKYITMQEDIKKLTIDYCGKVFLESEM